MGEGKVTREELHAEILKKLKEGNYSNDEMDKLMEKYTTMAMGATGQSDKKKQAKKVEKPRDKDSRNSLIERLQSNVQNTTENFRKSTERVLKSMRDNKPEEITYKEMKDEER